MRFPKLTAFDLFARTFYYVYIFLNQALPKMQITGKEMRIFLSPSEKKNFKTSPLKNFIFFFFSVLRPSKSLWCKEKEIKILACMLYLILINARFNLSKPALTLKMGYRLFLKKLLALFDILWRG